MKKIAIPLVSLRVVRDGDVWIDSPACDDARKAAEIAFQEIGNRETEMLILIALDGKSCCTGVAVVATGSMHGLTVSVTTVLRTALAMKATGFVLAHNHPSGDPRPSPEDLFFTARVNRAAEVVGLAFVDHVIVTDKPGEFRSIPMNQEEPS